MADGTPSAKWRENGELDPHAGKYDGERAELCLGYLTDDELANEAFLNYDYRPTPDQIIAGTHHSPIAYMTAVKERIRWLSRALEREMAQRHLLGRALVYSAHAQHATPLHMLPKGVTLIDANGVTVTLPDGEKVEAHDRNAGVQEVKRD